MLAFLHTARAHVQNFERLAREFGHVTPIRHEVQERLLADTLRAGAVTDAVRAATTSAVQVLAGQGARVIVCTCSTIGAVAEMAPVGANARVMRIDRPMAEQAVASGRRILVLAALRSTFEPTVSLLRRIASETTRSIELVQVFCERAWGLFELDDQAGYLGEIARTIKSVARPNDLVLLAQASMAPAAELVGHLGIPVLSSPKPGVKAALSLYRALENAPPNSGF
jgi:hypothetical protein